MIGADRLDGLSSYLPDGMTAADATHELNNLLTVVLGSLEQLERQALDRKGKAQLERAQLALEHANGLLQSLVGPNAASLPTD